MALMYSFPNLEPVRCSMSSSNCCFLVCLQISQEAEWWSGILIYEEFSRVVVIPAVKGFGVVNKAKVYIYIYYLALSMMQQRLAI